VDYVVQFAFITEPTPGNFVYNVVTPLSSNGQLSLLTPLGLGSSVFGAIRYQVFAKDACGNLSPSSRLAFYHELNQPRSDFCQ
jgi:hypothetical protein